MTVEAQQILVLTILATSLAWLNIRAGTQWLKVGTLFLLTLCFAAAVFLTGKWVLS